VRPSVFPHTKQRKAIVFRRCLVWVAGGLKQIAARTPAHHQAETKQQRFFEQKDSKASKVFGSVLN
jgi:hypothetical protein